jgi:phage repressor protein C with HTH and peptisase S24 domain
MLSHLHIWAGIDALAKGRFLTPSGLARLAGLDPTTFNRSKRFGPDGKPRWPSTESIAKVLEATGVSFPEFAAIAAGPAPAIRAMPLLSLAQASEPGCFDEAGLPIGTAWEAIDFPGLSARGGYALEIAGDGLAPTYRDGDRIIVAPGLEVRPGDRVVVRTVGGDVTARVLGRVTARRIELLPLDRKQPTELLDVNEVAWIARVLWASQ